MKNRNRILALVMMLLMLALSGCAENVNPGNYPYEPDTPAPDPHNGVFVSEYGIMTFNGDGKTITLNVGQGLDELLELPEGEYTGTYVFLSGDLPPNGSFPIRYDVAHELQIDLDNNGKEYSKVFDVGIAAEDGKTGTVGVDVVTEDRIPLLFNEDGVFFDVVFVKE